MTTKLLNLLITVTFMSSATAQISLEQYYYVRHKDVIPVFVFNYENPGNLHVETRFNYDAENAFSIYLGKSLFYGSKIKYTITPTAGAVVGRLKGVSSGANAFIEYKKLTLSLQSQCTILNNSNYENRSDFLFAWSELDYQPWPWLFLGLSAQNTYTFPTKLWLSEPGAVLGFEFGKWTIPIYCFNLMSDDRYIVLGINFQGGLSGRYKK